MGQKHWDPTCHKLAAGVAAGVAAAGVAAAGVAAAGVAVAGVADAASGLPTVDVGGNFSSFVD